MKITFQTDKLKAIIEKLNHVATGNPGDDDDQSPYIRVDVTTHDGELRVRMQACNRRMTQWLGCAVPAADCEPDEEGSFCIPVGVLHRLLNLCVSDEVTLQTESGAVVVKEDRPGGSTQSIATIPSDSWLGVKRYDGEVESLSVPRRVLVDAAAALSFAACNDETRAPLTGVHLTFQNGRVRGQATNGFLAAMWECDDADIKCDGTVRLLLLPEVLKKLVGLADKDLDAIEVEVEPTMVTFMMPLIRFRASLEVSMDSYPDLPKELSAKDDFWVELPWQEFQRAIALIHTVAPKSICNFLFTRDGRFAISAEHGGNRGKQAIEVTDKYGLPFEERVTSLAGCFDVLNATSCRKLDSIRVGVLRPCNEHLPDLMFLQSTDGWRTVFYRVVQGA